MKNNISDNIDRQHKNITFLEKWLFRLILLLFFCMDAIQRMRNQRGIKRGGKVEKIVIEMHDK